MMPKVFTSELTFGDCIRCDGILVQRTNRKTGHTFIGCSRWPHCDYTKRGGSNPAAPRVFDGCGVYGDSGSDMYYDDVYDDGSCEDPVDRDPWDDAFDHMDWGDND